LTDSFILVRLEIKKLREQIATAIYSHLQKTIRIIGIGFANAITDNFASAIDEVLSNQTMRELCSKDPELAEKITQEILDFVNNTKKKLNKTQSPFENEIELKHEFQQSKNSEFKSKWEKVNPIIKNNYDKKELDTTFYEKEFNRSLDEKNKKRKGEAKF
jgi:hypothetical protein